jgi:hypothetical protein
MSKINKDKTAKAALIAKLWQSVGYQNTNINCGNCHFADDWDEGSGKCNVLGKMSFPVREEAICRLHSGFNHE